LDILIFSINYWPEQFGIAPFATGRAEFLASRGHHVTVCTGFPYYPDWRVLPHYRKKIIATEAVNGVTILRSWLYVPGRVSSVTRMIHEASFVASTFARALGHKRPELILAISPPLGLGLVALLLGRLWAVPYTVHVADLQPDAAADLGMIRNRGLLAFLYWVERLVYRNAVLISSLTPPMRDRVISKGVKEDKVALFPDWADPLLFGISIDDQGRGFRERFGFDSNFLVTHSGNMGVKQGLDVVLDAAAEARDKRRVKFLLVGDGAARPTLEKQAKRRSLENVCFVPTQPKAMFLELLAATDLALITQQRSVADIVFPSKTITLLAAGRPVVASVNAESEVARVINASGAGVVVPPEDSRALLQAISELQCNSYRRKMCGLNGRAYAQDTWERVKILEQMEQSLLKAGARH